MSVRGGLVSEQELERQAKDRRAVIRHAQEVTGNVARTCRYYGIRSADLLQLAPSLRGVGA